MPDAMGHSWTGLGPRACQFCGAIEGSKQVREPCTKAPEWVLTEREVDRLDEQVEA